MLEGIDSRDCKNGARYMKLHYTADPGKRGDWATEQRKKIPEREWLREMEMREDVYDGEPVFPDYRDARHAPLMDSIPIVRGSTYFAGWDAGQTMSPAFVLFQVTPFPHQVQAILEVVCSTPEPMQTFCPMVLAAVGRRIPHAWTDILHYGDRTITTRDGSYGATAQSVARKMGVEIKASSNQLAGRLGAMTWLLIDNIAEDAPRLIIDRKHCPVMREALQGAYRYEESPRSDGVGYGRILASPLKNSYSHVMDAAQYGAMAVQKAIQKGVGNARNQPR